MIIAYLDSESTGLLDPLNPPHIVQIAVILEDDTTGRILHQVCLLVNPGVPIPATATAVHGITDEMVQEYGWSQLSADGTVNELLMAADRVVAHNMDFDYGVIRNVFPWSSHTMSMKDRYCTMEAGALVPDIPKHHAGGTEFPTLADSYKYFTGKEIIGAHDALVDAEACRQVYKGLQGLKHVSAE